MDFYTHVATFGNNILYRGIVDGKPVRSKIDYSPSLFIPAKKVTNYTNLNGDYLEQKIFGDIRSARDYFKQFEGITTIYGNNRYEYAFIADQHKGLIEWDRNKVTVGIIDIEVGSENGFPDPYKAEEPITAIALKYLNGPMYVFACGDYVTQGDEVYVKCKDEWTLCKNFITQWSKKYPDIITGWNTKFFDIPYLVNRFKRILGEKEMKKLSPWYHIGERNTKMNNRQLTVYEILGVSSLDYIELYKWYAPEGKSQESYKLNDIAVLELGEGKTSYEEYDNLNQLYRLNFQKFIEYNIRDVDIIVRFEAKLKLLELAMTLAYYTKSNFEDVFAQTRMWDSMIYSYLIEQNIVVPPRVVAHKDSAFEGAYVKETQNGMHKWVVSFDLNSLYSHLMMQYNISPETLIEPENYTPRMREIIQSGVSVDKMLKKEVDTSGLEKATITPNGQFFRTDIQGFLPKMLYEMYEGRKKYKKLMLQAQQEYENETDEQKKKVIGDRVARYNNLQLALKVSLNSAYGALGSQYFRFYDLRMALAVTLSGQLSIQWIENKLNGFMNKLLKTDNDYVIASDTDSIYLRLGPLVESSLPGNALTSRVIDFMDKACATSIEPFIDKSYKELAYYVNAYEQKMQMKREALCDKGIWTGKKHYILNVFNSEGVAYAEPKIKVKGLEMVKSSTPAIIRKKMKEAIGIMMNGTEETIHKFFMDFKGEFNKLPPEDISFPRGMNGLDKWTDAVSLYKSGTPIHVKGAILYNAELKKHNLEKRYPLIQDGEKLKYAWLKVPNPIKNTVISFPTRLPREFGLEKYIDYDVQYQKSFIEPIKVILDCIGWSVEKQNTLEDFFG